MKALGLLIFTLMCTQRALAQDALLHSLKHKSPGLVWSLDFSPDGRWLATGSSQHSVHIWDVKTGQLFRTLPGHRHLVKSVAFSPGGKYVASGSSDGTARIWDVQTGALLHVLRGARDTQQVLSVAFSKNGEYLATGSNDETAKVWNAMTGELIAHFSVQSSVSSVAFSPDSRTLATGAAGALTLWDLQSRKPSTVAKESVSHVWFSPDGERLIAASGSTLKVLDVITHNLVRQWSCGSHINAAALSLDGQMLATGFENSTVKYWTVETGDLLGTSTTDDGKVLSVAFSSDGERVATGSFYSIARIWKRSVAPLTPHFTKQTLLQELVQLARYLPRSKAEFLRDIVTTTADATGEQTEHILCVYLAIRPLIQSLDSKYGDLVRHNYLEAAQRYGVFSELPFTETVVRSSLAVIVAAIKQITGSTNSVRTTTGIATADPSPTNIEAVVIAIDQLLAHNPVLFEARNTAWIAQTLQEQAEFLRGVK